MYSTISKSTDLQKPVRNISWLTITNVDATIATVESFDSYYKKKS